MGDFSEETSAMQKSEAKSSGVLPAGFVFRTTPYSGLDQRDLTVKVSVLTGANKIMLKPRINQHKQVIEEMANEFKEVLKEDLEDTEMAIYIGSF